MMPHGAPTTKFSTRWQSIAIRSAGSIVTPSAPRLAIIVATSTAAEEETPLALGHRRAHEDRDAAAGLQAALLSGSWARTPSTPATYAAHFVLPVAPNCARRVASGVAATPSPAKRLSSDVSNLGTRPVESPPSETAVIMAVPPAGRELRRSERRLRDWHLQHE